MGFWLSCSNRVESLQQQLCARLQESPLRDPFQAEFILVPGNAMRRWLGLQIAMEHGVAAKEEPELLLEDVRAFFRTLR